MWGKKEDQPGGDGQQATASQPGSAPPREASQASQPSGASKSAAQTSASRMGKSVKFKGEIHSDEDFFIDGAVEGSIVVPKHSVVLGSTARVYANIDAMNIAVHGQVRGKLNATDRLTIAKTGRFEGELVTRRLEIHDGAVFIGTSAQQESKQAKPSPSGQAQAAADKAGAAPKADPGKAAEPKPEPAAAAASPQAPAKT